MSDRPKILGINKRWYPRPGHDRDVCLIVVLVEGDIGDYAAYAAIGEDEMYAARFGDKISFAEATCNFPMGLEREKYRS